MVWKLYAWGNRAVCCLCQTWLSNTPWHHLILVWLIAWTVPLPQIKIVLSLFTTKTILIWLFALKERFLKPVFGSRWQVEKLWFTVDLIACILHLLTSRNCKSILLIIFLHNFYRLCRSSFLHKPDPANQFSKNLLTATNKIYQTWEQTLSLADYISSLAGMTRFTYETANLFW